MKPGHMMFKNPVITSKTRSLMELEPGCKLQNGSYVTKVSGYMVWLRPLYGFGWWLMENISGTVTAVEPWVLSSCFVFLEYKPTNPQSKLQKATKPTLKTTEGKKTLHQTKTTT